MKKYIQILKSIVLEWENEKLKVRQNQERLDQEEIRTTQNQERLDREESRTAQNQIRLDNLEQLGLEGFAHEKEIVKQNQERLDNLEQLGLESFAHEKEKVRQNQERLDHIERLGLEGLGEKVSQNQLRLDNLERTVRAQKHEIDLLLNAAINRDLGIKRFNFLDKTTNSQSGEDAILAYVVTRLKIPFDECTYLDLGANKPVEGSNTNFFYSQGARGVLVEANPDLIPDLKKIREEDIVLNYCVDIEDGIQREFIIMSDDGLSTINPDEIGHVQEINPDIKVKSKVMVESITVNTIMEKYFSSAPVICSIDVEGKDLELLQSIDFDKHRPLLVIVEMIEYSNDLAINDKNEDIYNYMKTAGYEEYAFTGINSIFIDKIALKEKWNYKKI